MSTQVVSTFYVFFSFFECTSNIDELFCVITMDNIMEKYVVYDEGVCCYVLISFSLLFFLWI